MTSKVWIVVLPVMAVFGVGASLVLGLGVAAMEGRVARNHAQARRSGHEEHRGDAELPKRADAPEDRSERSDSNDERLKRDVPPHW